MKRFVRVKKNKKVKNATPIKVDGVQYRSKLEAYCAHQLKENGVDAVYEEKVYTLIPKFEYNGTKIRACTYTPDFTGDGFIIDVKGWGTDTWKIKWKMLIKQLADDNKILDLYLPKNQTQVRQIIEDILTKKKLNEDTKTVTTHGAVTGNSDNSSTRVPKTKVI